MDAQTQDRIYQRIGEFVVGFQWIENRLREIGWLLLEPDRSTWPPTALRDLGNKRLIDEVERLVTEALPKCNLDVELEMQIRESFRHCVSDLHRLRQYRNRILHSAYVELKAGGDVAAVLRSDSRPTVDENGSELSFDQEILQPDSFDTEMSLMGEVALVLNRVYLQLIHRYRSGA